MTSVIAVIPKIQFSSATGAPLANGTLTTYLAGTTTPTPTWQDQALTILNTNPVQLDSRGECILWLDSTVVYKFVLKNAAGVTQWTQDNITNTGSGANISFIQAGTGAVATTVQAKLREIVTVTDFSGLQVAVDAGFTLIKIPQTATVTLTGNISIPAGVSMQIDGTVTGAGRLDFLGSCNVFGAGVVACGATWCMSVAAGDISISGLTIGKAACHGILIYPTAQINSIRIQNNRIRGVQYGILRTPIAAVGDISVLNAEISGNIIENCSGDGIEWNIGPLDRRVSIRDNTIFNVNGTVVNSGIGIGVAGRAYNNTSDLSTYMQQVDICGNIIHSARQGIHVEASSKFRISGNTVSDITSAYGHSSIAVMGIIVYAAEKCHITDNMLFDNDGGIQADFGVVAAVFTGSPRDIVIEGNTLIDSDSLRTKSAKFTSQATAPVVAIKSNTIMRGGIIHEGACNLAIDSNTVKSAAGQVGFTLDYCKSIATGFLPSTGYILRITNNQVFDEIGRVNVSIANVAHPSGFDGNFSVFQAGNSFSIAVADVAYQSVNRTIFTTEAALAGAPYGVELQVGTLIIDTATPARNIVTVAGSRNRATDTYTVGIAASGIIYSSNYVWTSGSNHTLGQAITLTDGVITPVAGYVGWVDSNGGNYRIGVVNSAGSPLDLGALGAGTITATNPLTTVAV